MICCREPTLMDETDAPEIPQWQFDHAELLLYFLEEAEVFPLDKSTRWPVPV
jgi:hypothetical protein